MSQKNMYLQKFRFNKDNLLKTRDRAPKKHWFNANTDANERTST